MKGSLIRKRYILVFWEVSSASADRDLYNYYGIKRKYRNDKFCIYMCNQLNRNSTMKIIRNKGGYTIITSGTIKKCKNAISKFNMEEASH
ncbi:MAG: hypothetical protein QXZ44_02915 [Ferroplasma sp.]